VGSVLVKKVAELSGSPDAIPAAIGSIVATLREGIDGAAA
jgi:hypothetical protein